MASLDLRHPENVDGDVFVDTTCIDCDTCRWMAPATFARAGGQSVVRAQPETDEEREAALRALVSCPTASIGTVGKHAMGPVLDGMPIPVDANVYHCGYHHEASFGAASYIVVREAGNVLVDSPRFAKPLVRNVERMGGVATMFLTHRDDVAEHEKWAAHFGCERVLHRADDVGGGIERLLDGDEPVALDDELSVIPVPGHTRGSACLLYRDTYLFSGDHVAWSDRRGRVIAFREVCWYDWGVQAESMRRLARHDFEWILPGHGRRCRLSRERMREEIERTVAWMEER